MGYGLTQTVAPSSRAVSLTDAKRHLRVDGNDDDLAIGTLIDAATGRLEEETYRQLVSATWRMRLDEWPCDPDDGILLPRAPLQSVTSISYVDLNGVTQTVPTSVYVVAPDREPGEIRLKYGQVWPFARNEPNAITIDFIAGYGAASAVPGLLKSAILLMVGDWFENREDSISGTISKIPTGAQRIIDLYQLGDEFLAYGSGEDE